MAHSAAFHFSKNQYSQERYHKLLALSCLIVSQTIQDAFTACHLSTYLTAVLAQSGQIGSNAFLPPDSKGFISGNDDQVIDE